MAEDIITGLDNPTPVEPTAKSATVTRTETVEVFQREYVEKLRKENERYRKAATEYKDKASKLEPFETELNDLRAKYDELINKQREQFLAKIPEGKRDKYKEFPLEVLQTVAEDLDVQILKTPGTDGDKPAMDIPLQERSQEDWMKLKTTNPRQYEADMEELIKNVKG